MKAAVVTEKGVQYTDAHKPAPKANEILIKVKAASLNRADLAVASGHSHGRIGGAGTIVGLECAGEVEAVGADALGRAEYVHEWAHDALDQCRARHTSEWRSSPLGVVVAADRMARRQRLDAAGHGGRAQWELRTTRHADELRCARHRAGADDLHDTSAMRMGGLCRWVMVG